MIPFKVFDRKSKVTWLVLNYHPTSKGGEYLAAREDESKEDGKLAILTAEEITQFRMIGLVESVES